QAVYNQAFHHVTSEKMALLNGTGGYKVQIVGVKIWAPVCHFPSPVCSERIDKSALLAGSDGDLTIPFEQALKPVFVHAESLHLCSRWIPSAGLS
ncbi:unnamed protein product, partial [marine sediment metagenome]